MSGHEFGHVLVTVESDTMLGVSSQFHGVAAALEEVKDARVSSGIHFRTATEAGTTLATGAANYVLGHLLQRVN